MSWIQDCYSPAHHLPLAFLTLGWSSKFDLPVYVNTKIFVWITSCFWIYTTLCPGSFTWHLFFNWKSFLGFFCPSIILQEWQCLSFLSIGENGKEILVITMFFGQFRVVRKRFCVPSGIDFLKLQTSVEKRRKATVSFVVLQEYHQPASVLLVL